MAETQRELVPYQVDMQCDCGGRMRPTGFAKISNPPQYPHRCDVCDKLKRYPYIDFKPKE